MSWTDERIATLSKLWLDGLSGSQIARQLGGVTRNAVIGKVHRLGLSGRTADASGGGKTRAPRPPKSKPAKAPRAPQAPGPKKPRAVAAEVVPIAPAFGLATRLSVSDRVCKWPIGEPTADDFRYCGRPVEKGSYCPSCAGVAFKPAAVRSREDRHLVQAFARYA